VDGCQLAACATRVPEWNVSLEALLVAMIACTSWWGRSASMGTAALGEVTQVEDSHDRETLYG